MCYAVITTIEKTKLKRKRGKNAGSRLYYNTIVFISIL